jgi:tungstate transport system permease protein
MNPILEGLAKAFELIISLDPEVMSITFLSFQISGLSVLLGTLIGIPLGMFLSFKDFFGKRLIVTINSTFMGLPPVVVGLFVYLLLSRSGPFGPLQLLYTPSAMIIVQLIMAIPIVTGITLSSANGVEKSIKETAISLGASRIRLILVVLREARFGILTAVITSFGAAISEVGGIMIAGGDIRWHTRVLTTAVVLATRKGEYGMAIALGIILLFTAFLVNLFLNRLQQRGVSR